MRPQRDCLCRKDGHVVRGAGPVVVMGVCACVCHQLQQKNSEANTIPSNCVKVFPIPIFDGVRMH